MRQKSQRHQDTAERPTKDIPRHTWKRYSYEEKVGIVPAGLGGSRPSETPRRCRGAKVRQRPTSAFRRSPATQGREMRFRAAR